MTKHSALSRGRKGGELTATLEFYRNRTGLRSWVRWLAENPFPMHQRTLYDRLRNPDRFTLGEIRALGRQLQIPDEVLRPLL